MIVKETYREIKVNQIKKQLNERINIVRVKIGAFNYFELYPGAWLKFGGMVYSVLRNIILLNNVRAYQVCQC